MTDARDFLAAIIDRPDDDLPRLVFADYLDETGDEARAEFIRVQCELARLPADHPARPALTAREKGLLAAHKLDWVVPEVESHQEFRRGFVEFVRITAEGLIRAAGRLFRAAPVRALRVQNIEGFADTVARLPELARVESLDLTNTSFDTAQRLLWDAPLTSLRRLTVCNAQVWPERLQALARSPVAGRLHGLNVSGNPLTDEGAQVLAAEPAFAGLRELAARRDGVWYEQRIHGAGTAALAGSRTLAGLRRLDLAGQAVGDSGLVALARSPNSARLTDLDLSANGLGETGPAGFEALVESPHLRHLTRLRLGGEKQEQAGNRLDRLAAEALASWPALAAGARVDLRRCEIDPAGRAALAASPWADRFTLDD
jgi:uncharacterized protein (TIGR02996 family)